jgi:Phage tail tube protein
MATMDPIRFGDIALQLGNGADPGETFETLCGFTSLTHSYNVNTTNEDLPDCAGDGDEVGFEGATKISVGEQIAFQGFVDPEASDAVRELAYADDPVNIRLAYNKGTKVGYLQGPAILTAGEESWERRQSGRMSGTLKFTAKPVWTAT